MQQYKRQVLGTNMEEKLLKKCLDGRLEDSLIAQ